MMLENFVKADAVAKVYNVNELPHLTEVIISQLVSAEGWVRYTQ